MQKRPNTEARFPWYSIGRASGNASLSTIATRASFMVSRLPIGTGMASLKLDALLLNAGGSWRFYPTTIPYHHKSAYLDNKNIFGDFTKASKQRGMRGIAHLHCNYAYEEAWKAHPEWFEGGQNGDAIKHNQSPRLYKTCMYSTYFSEQMPAVIREINSLYDVDGFFTNGWPSTARLPACHCAECRTYGDPSGPEYYQHHLDRILEIWKLWHTTAKQEKWDSVNVGNFGGGIRAVTDVQKIADVAGSFNADHQGRTGNTPICDCAQQGRVAQSMMKGRTITNVTGSYANAHPLWRHTSKSPEEARMWMAQTTAGGMVPRYQWLGGAPNIFGGKKLLATSSSGSRVIRITSPIAN